MDVETTTAKMVEQVAAFRRSAMTRDSGWTLEIAPPTIFIRLGRAAEPSRVYTLRVQFDDFDRRAPSYMFVDPETGIWTPNCRPANVEHSDRKICTPGTREFHEDLHKNDLQYAWDPAKYPLLATVRMIQRMMNS